MGDFRIPQRKMKLEVLDCPDEREHFHQDIELLFVLEGDMTVVVGDEKISMHREDILIVNANKRHCVASVKDILYMKLTIQWQLVSDIFQSMNIIFWCDSTKGDNKRYDQLRELLKKLLNHYLSTHGSYADFRHISLCYQVMDILSIHFLVRSTDRLKQSDQDKFDDRIAQINNYIRANYNMPISLTDLADKLYLSVSYLSRFFKKNYGMNFASYLENIRMHYAMEELLYTDTPITRIVYDNGFSSVTAFNRIFKEINGETPSAMRRRYQDKVVQEPQAETSPEIEARLEQFLRDGDSIGEDEGENKRSIHREVVIGDTLCPTKFIWNDMINLGAASDLMRSEVREHIILLKQNFRFRYVRFWNLFSSEMLFDFSVQDGHYNFSRLDSILEFLLSQDLKPHIELGFKPKRIHRNLLNALLLDDEGSSKMEWAQVLKILHALMRHLIHRYGREEIDSWRMELWFEESKWAADGGMDDYLYGFSCIQKLLREYSPDIRFGGSGLPVDRLEASIERFLRLWSAAGCKPDFLSIGYYAYERYDEHDDENVRRSTDNEHMLHRISMIRSIMDRTGFSDTILYISEWNLTISDRNAINDSCFKGAYIVKNMLDIYGIVDSAGYFVGSDRVSDYYDSPELLYGGTGLLSKDGILKPSGFAFSFLNRMYPYFVAKGTNDLITTNGKDSLGILCHNQKALNYNYYFTPEDKIEKAHLWKYFEDRDCLDLTFHLDGITDGQYKLKIYRVNEQSGNLMEIWEEMQFDSELSRNDIDYLRHTCEPKLFIQKKEAKNNRLELSLRLAANEIAYIHIRRLF